MWGKLYGIIYYGAENQIFKFRTCGNNGGYYMFVLVWKNKEGKIETISTVRESSRWYIMDYMKRLEQKDKLLTIIEYVDSKIIYNSGTGWIE